MGFRDRARQSGWRGLSCRGGAMRLCWLWLAMGCQGGPGAVEVTDCEVTFAPSVHNVLTASWSSSRPGASWVEYDLDGATQATPVVDDGTTSHSANLLGLRPLTEVAWTLFTEDADGQGSCSGVSQTENVLPQTIGLEIEHYDAALSGPEPFVYGTAFGRSPRSSVFVVSKIDGSFRWHLQGDEGAQVVFAQFAADASGRQVLANGVTYNQFDIDHSEDIGAIHVASPVGERVADLTTPLAHHSYTQMPDGTITYLSLDFRNWTEPGGNVFPVAGDTIHEIGVDGVDRQIFNVFDHEAIAPNVHWGQSLYPGYLDWSHADGIRWNAALEAYVVPFAHLEQVWLIGRDGVPKLRVGRDTSVPVEDGVHWALPHDASILDDGSLLVFLVNENLPGSGCHQFTIGTDRLTEVWSYEARVVGRFLGKCTRLPGGNTLVGFGSGGQIHEVTPSGEVAWVAQVTDVAGLGAVGMFSDLY
jgi:hypothetical protein